MYWLGHIQSEVFYPDLDAGASGSAQPVTVGAETQSIDDITTVQGVQVLALIKVPQHGLAVLKAKSDSIMIFMSITYSQLVEYSRASQLPNIRNV